MGITNLLTDGDFEDYTGWGLSVTLPNWVSYHIDANNAYTRNVSRRLLKTVAGSCKTFQTVDLNRNIGGEDFEVGAWIKIATCNSGGGAELYFEWLDSIGNPIGNVVTIAILSTVADFTLASTTETAPAGAEQIKFWFVLTGGTVDVTAYLDNAFIYEEKEYGLKVYDALGNNSFILPDISSIISAGTISLPDILEDDGTYGVDIDLPGDEYIDAKNIGVIVQARDFDWKTVIEILSYDSGNKFWGTFFGDDSISYYEKSPDSIMTVWTAGNMTPGTQSTYNPLLNMSILAGWDRFATSIKKVRLFAALFYTFLKTVAAGDQTFTLYARDYGTTVSGVIGYMLATGQGAIEKYVTLASTAGYSYHWPGSTTSFDISVLHSDGSETSLATGVALQTINDWSYGEATWESQHSADWSCPGYGSWVSSDTLKFKLNISLWAENGNHTSFQNVTGSITFVLPVLGWTALNASTWTLYKYVLVHQDTGMDGTTQLKIYFGTSTKEVKATNVSAAVTGSAQQNVCSIGANGVSEIDYMIYLKNYDGS